jgi:hypothetical protein
MNFTSIGVILGRPRKNEPPSLCHISLPYMTCSDIRSSTKEFNPHARTIACITLSAADTAIILNIVVNIASCEFHNLTHYANSLLSRLHVRTADLLNITCTLLAIGVILGRPRKNEPTGGAAALSPSLSLSLAAAGGRPACLNLNSPPPGGSRPSSPHRPISPPLHSCAIY